MHGPSEGHGKPSHRPGHTAWGAHWAACNSAGATPLAMAASASPWYTLHRTSRRLQGWAQLPAAHLHLATLLAVPRVGGLPISHRLQRRSGRLQQRSLAYEDGGAMNDVVCTRGCLWVACKLGALRRSPAAPLVSHHEGAWHASAHSPLGPPAPLPCHQPAGRAAPVAAAHRCRAAPENWGAERQVRTAAAASNPAHGWAGMPTAPTHLLKLQKVGEGAATGLGSKPERGSALAAALPAPAACRRRSSSAQTDLAQAHGRAPRLQAGAAGLCW